MLKTREEFQLFDHFLQQKNTNISKTQKQIGDIGHISR